MEDALPGELGTKGNSISGPKSAPRHGRNHTYDNPLSCHKTPRQGETFQIEQEQEANLREYRKYPESYRKGNRQGWCDSRGVNRLKDGKAPVVDVLTGKVQWGRDLGSWRYSQKYLDWWTMMPEQNKEQREARKDRQCSNFYNQESRSWEWDSSHMFLRVIQSVWNSYYILNLKFLTLTLCNINISAIDLFHDRRTCYFFYLILFRFWTQILGITPSAITSRANTWANSVYSIFKTHPGYIIC